MVNNERRGDHREPRLYWVGVCLFGVIGVFFLWEGHRAHILSALAWGLLLACPLIHFFMHGHHSHGSEGKHNRTHQSSDSERSEGGNDGA